MPSAKNADHAHAASDLAVLNSGTQTGFMKATTAKATIRM